MRNSEPGSSVSTVSSYKQDDRALKVQSAAEAKEFFLKPPCSDGLWGPPSLLYKMYTGGPYVGGKVRPLDTRPHLMPRSRVNMSYTSSPISPFVACSLSIISLEIPVSHCGEHVDDNLHGD
jgi:hypothetical protein